MAKALSLLAVAATAASAAAACAIPSAAAHRRSVISHRPAAVLAALEAAHLGTGRKLASTRAKRSSAPRLPSVSLVNQEWVCDSPVDLASVTVRMTPAYRGGRRGGDAVHLMSGCTGHIGKLTVVTSIADGVKIADGAHDLTIGSGSIRCLGKLPRLHQDGVQAMGGTRITLRRLRIDCGRVGQRLINSNLFIREAGRAASPPTDVVCVGCFLGPEAAHTVTIRRSIRSGVKNSRLCAAKYPRLTLHVGSDAVHPVVSGDSVGGC